MVDGLFLPVYENCGYERIDNECCLYTSVLLRAYGAPPKLLIFIVYAY